MRIKDRVRGPRRRLLMRLLLLLLASSPALLLLSVEAHLLTGDRTTTPSAFQEPQLVRRYQQMITPESLASRLYFLASDMFEGRETSSRGQHLAAQFLASEYRRLGLQPKGTVKTEDPFALESYFQPFKLYKREARRAELTVKINGEQVASSTFSQSEQDDLSYFAFGKLAPSKGGVVFAGYGIEDDSLSYNDFAALRQQKISVDGKWIMILADEPLRDASTSLLPTADHKPSKWSGRIFDKKLALFRSGHPAGILVVSDLSPRASKSFAELARQAAASAQAIGNLSLYPGYENPFPPTYTISTKLADRILSASGRTVRELAQEINGKLKPVVFDVKGAQVSSGVEPFEPLETENVLAFIEGSDPRLKDEVVVVSAHFDHLGINPQAKGDQIYNGAADDGSGTVATLAIAESFMQAKRAGMGPRRSILFLNLSGEEKGLLGSAFYTDMQPVIPLDRIVADINMDGVGGEDTAHAKTNPNYVYIVGKEDISSELLAAARRLNQLTGTDLLLDESPNFNPGSSDHFNFQKQLVPYIFYSTGLTEHYHKPSDEAQTINYEHMARVVRLSFATIWQTVNADTTPERASRDRLVLKGYACPACNLECDQLSFDSPGVCPVCEMTLAPKYELKK